MSKKYNIIYADPPWSFNSVKTGGSMKSGAADNYPTMTLEQMKKLDVPAICEKDCVLIMWYVSSQPQEALDLVKAWGFTVKNMNCFIWQKLTTNLMPHFGMGYWTRAGAECALIAVRGKPKSENKAIRQVRAEMLGEHSEKPAVFRDEIVKLCGDLPRLEMFARCIPAGWDVWGNEVEKSLTIDGETEAQAPKVSQEINHKWSVEVTELVCSTLKELHVAPAESYYNRLCTMANHSLLNGASPEHVIELIKKEANPCAA
jgi:N6-adenosine-specific RNA methylase IME4